MLLLDCITIVMLLITIVYCWKLNNKMTELKKNRREFQAFIQNIDNALIKAHTSIKELQALTAQTSTDISENLNKARLVVDDLTFMTDRASVLTDKLEQIINTSRHLESGSTKPTITVPNSLENQFSNNEISSATKKSTIETLLAKIASVKDNRKATSMLEKAKLYDEA